MKKTKSRITKGENQNEKIIQTGKSLLCKLRCKNRNIDQQT
jgi:hypothetical protein